MRHHVGLNLAHEVHRHNDHDQQRGAAEVERHVETQIQEFRHKAHKCQIRGPAQRQTHEHLIDVTRRLLTRTDTGHKRTAFLQILSRFLRIENKSRVEKSKENDERGIKKRVKRLPGA